MDFEVRHHHLKTIQDLSLAHLRARLDKDLIDHSSSSMTKGSAVGHILFGTQKVVYATMRRDDRSKEYQAFKADNTGSFIVTKDEYDTAHRMADAIRAHRRASEILLPPGAILERTLIWQHRGRACRVTPDSAAPDYSWFSDLKTTRCAKPEIFDRDARRFRYPSAMDYYRTGIRSMGLGTVAACYLVVVESSAPYPVVVRPMHESILDEGREFWTAAFEKLLEAERTGNWGGYSDIDVPMESTNDNGLTGFDDEAEPETEAA